MLRESELSGSDYSWKQDSHFSKANRPLAGWGSSSRVGDEGKGGPPSKVLLESFLPWSFYGEGESSFHGPSGVLPSLVLCGVYLGLHSQVFPPVLPSIIPRSFQQSFPSGLSGGWGVPCDLSHNALDVTCLLSRHQLMGVAWCSCLYTAGTPPPHSLTDWQICLKTLQTYAGGNNKYRFYQENEQMITDGNICKLSDCTNSMNQSNLTTVIQSQIQ